MARKPPKLDEVGYLLEAVQRAHGPGVHSPTYKWMRRHHDRLAAGLDGVRPSWIAIADRLGELGVLDGTGKTPTAQAARNTWYRVQRDVAAARAGRTPKSDPILEQDEIAPGVTSISAREPEPVGSPVQPDITPPAQPLADPLVLVDQAEDVIPALSPAESKATEGAAEQLRRVFGEMDARTVPIPRQLSS